MIPHTLWLRLASLKKLMTVSSSPWIPDVFINLISSNIVLVVKTSTSVNPNSLISFASFSSWTKVFKFLGKTFKATSSIWSKCIWVTIIASTFVISSNETGNSTNGFDKWLLGVPIIPGYNPFGASIGSTKNFLPAYVIIIVAFLICFIFIIKSPFINALFFNLIN